MRRVEPSGPFRFWEYCWFVLVTAILLAVGLMVELIRLPARLLGAKRR